MKASRAIVCVTALLLGAASTYGTTWVADYTGNQAIAVNSAGTVVRTIPVGGKPRDVEKLPNGNILVVVETPGMVEEYDASNTLVWSYGPFAWGHDAERLDNGNTLITDYSGNRVIEVDSAGNIQWSFQQAGLGPIDADRLPNGNTLITDWNNNRVIEVNKWGTAIVWDTSTIATPVALNRPTDAERVPGTWLTLITDYYGGAGAGSIQRVAYNGVQQWAMNATKPMDVEVVDSGDYLLTESTIGKVSQIDPITMTAWWTKVFPGHNIQDAERYVPHVWVDDDWNSQAAVDASPPAGPHPILVWQYNAFRTIQEGINAVTESTVHVLPGLYQQRIWITKSVNLIGAQAAVDPTVPGARPNSLDPLTESIIDVTTLGNPNPDIAVQIPAGNSDIVINGFSILGDPTNPTADTCVIRAGGGGTGGPVNRLRIVNNILDGKYGVLYKKGDGLLVARNRMTVNKVGVAVQPGPVNRVAIAQNVFALGTSPIAPDQHAIYMTDTSNVFVGGNTATGFVNGCGVCGSNLTRIAVRNNTLTGNKDGVSFWGNTTFVGIAQNDLSNCLRYGINIKSQDVLIRGNTINACGDAGVNVAQHAINTERIKLRNNTITNNVNFGVQVDVANVAQMVDARFNDWGHWTGPYDPIGTHEVPYYCSYNPAWHVNHDGQGNAVTEKVWYCPWTGGFNPKPFADTLDATGIGDTFATLNGQVASTTEPCQYNFYFWKPGDTWISVTGWTGSVDTGDAFSEVITGLTPGNRYYFWAAVKNYWGWSGLSGGVKIFTTLNSPVEVLKPNGGECLLGGSTFPIEWAANPDIADVLIEYSSDNGGTWDTITTVANTEPGEYLWAVPSLDSQQCLVRVSDATDPGTNDTSDGTFCITTKVAPDVVGMTQANAQTAIVGAGMTVGTVTENYSDTAPVGDVISQQPPAGTPICPGDVMDIVISKGPKPAPAAAPPVAQTQAATGVGSDTATLNGKIIDDGGGACEFRFMYWKSGDAWISSTAWQGYYFTNDAVSHVLTGLSANSRYFYWVEARNSAGKSAGVTAGVHTFTTSP